MQIGGEKNQVLVLETKERSSEDIIFFSDM